MPRYIDADKLKKEVLGLTNCYNGFSDTYDKACIIGLIDEMPTIEPPYELDEWCTDCSEYDQERNCCPRYNRVIRAAVEEAKANFTPKQGRWIRHVLKNANTPWGYDCSECDEWFVISYDTAERYNYCPNCGAKMDEVEE